MGQELRRLRNRKKVLSKMEELEVSGTNVYFIHYSCESFYDVKDGRTPRITSITIRNYESAQTESFSIHQIAEEDGISIKDITEHYDELETKMFVYHNFQ